MRMFRVSSCGLMLMAVATAGCAEVFGVEPPPALANAGVVYRDATPPAASGMYRDATPPAGPFVHHDATSPVVAPTPPQIIETHASVVILRVPAGALVTVKCEQTLEASAQSPDEIGALRGASREGDEPPPPAPYKPSPYVTPRAPSLYHTN